MTNFEKRGNRGDLSGHLHPCLHHSKVNWQKCHYWPTSIYFFTKKIGRVRRWGSFMSPKSMENGFYSIAPVLPHIYIQISCHTNSICYLCNITHSSKRYLMTSELSKIEGAKLRWGKVNWVSSATFNGWAHLIFPQPLYCIWIGHQLQASTGINLSLNSAFHWI